MAKISITKDVSEHELNSFHDCVYEAIGKSLSHKELLKLFENLPEDIQHTGLQWGLNDTVFRDNVYEHLEKERSFQVSKRITLTNSQRSALEEVLFDIFNEGVGMTPPDEIMSDYIDRIAEALNAEDEKNEEE